MIQGIYKEAEALKALSHKHIVKLYHGFIDGKRFVMIMEAAMGGQLLDYLKANKTFPETIAREILLQITQAMLYCHSRGVVHRDLKLENVLFKNQSKDDFFVKVVDFGIAGVSNEKVDAGTLSYMAPECLDRRKPRTAHNSSWLTGRKDTRKDDPSWTQAGHDGEDSPEQSGVSALPTRWSPRF